MGLLKTLWSALRECHLRKRLFGNASPRIGNRAYVDPSVQFIGSKYIQIGNRSIVSEGCWFNVNDRSGNEPKIVIGDHCYVGRRSFFSAGSKITVGAYCMISNESNIISADHDFSDPLRPYISIHPTPGAAISIGVNCWIGSSCTVLKGTTIGYGSVVGAGSVVTKSVPPLSLAVGNPCRTIKRFSPMQKKWVSVAKWTKEEEGLLPSDEEYVALLKKSCEWIPMPYIIGGHTMGNL